MCLVALLCPEGKVASALSNINQWKIKGKVPTIDRMEKVIDNESALFNQEETLKNKEVRSQKVRRNALNELNCLECLKLKAQTTKSTKKNEQLEKLEDRNYSFRIAECGLQN